jgi:hypothetical protein
MRRKLAALIPALTVWSCAGLAQVQRSTARIGVLLPTREDDVTRRVLSAFKRRLADLGWREGSNINYTVRYAEGRAANYGPLAAEAVAARPDLVFVSFAPFVSEVQKRTTDIPIVFMTSHDPVAEGLVASLAKPGGNATGVSTRSRELVAKRLEVMREVVPSFSRLGVVRLVGLPASEGVVPLVEELKDAAARLRLRFIEVDHDYRKAGAFAPAFARLIAAPATLRQAPRRYVIQGLSEARKCRKAEFRSRTTIAAVKRGIFASLGSAPSSGRASHVALARRLDRDGHGRIVRIARCPP